jgi:hypothetical protein
MARNRKSTSEVEKVRPYLEGVAKNLVDRLYGPQGPAWGTRLTELEDVVLAVRQFLSEQILEQALTRRAVQEERPPEYEGCPGCGRATQGQEPEPRLLQTQGGEVAWQEPHTTCRTCRQAFFPSEQELGD